MSNWSACPVKQYLMLALLKLLIHSQQTIKDLKPVAISAFLQPLLEAHETTNMDIILPRHMLQINLTEETKMRDIINRSYASLILAEA